jgi:hypothetical protein
MNNRLHTLFVLTRKKIVETLISPAFPIICTACLVLGYLSVTGFIGSIDSDGINPALNPAFELVIKFMSGVFGESFFHKLFSEGPFAFALIIAYIPVLIYLSVSSVFKFGFEKNTGALELVIYGPVSITLYVIAAFLRNLFFSLVYLTACSIILFFYALLTNTVPGIMFLTVLILLAFLSLAVYGYTVFCSVISANGLASLPIFLGFALFFIVLQLGTLIVTSGYVLNIWSILSWVFQWFSPLFYFSIGFSFLDYGNVFLLLLSIFLFCFLTSFLLTTSHIIAQQKGGAA